MTEVGYAVPEEEAKSEGQDSVSNGTNGALPDPYIPQNITLAQAEQEFYLSLAAQVSAAGGTLAGQTAAQGQQLISALENHTLKFTSANIPGYSETFQSFGVKGYGGSVGEGFSVSQSGSQSAIAQYLGTQNYFIMGNFGFTGWGNYGFIVSY